MRSCCHELRNAEQEVLRGSRSGKIYNRPESGCVKPNKCNKTAKVICSNL